MTIKEFAKQHHIRVKSERMCENPNMTDSRDMDHWKVRLTRRGSGGWHSRMTIYFSMGYGHNGNEPDVESVLSCLASDSSALDQDFENWASDLGYDPDSRKALRIFETCKRQAIRLEKFLAQELFDLLLKCEGS